MSRQPAYPNPEALAAEVEPWLQQCGSCDAALPMNCTCPPGDYRNVLLKVWQAYQASRLLVAEEIAAYAEDLVANMVNPEKVYNQGFAHACRNLAQAAREIGAKETQQ